MPGKLALGAQEGRISAKLTGNAKGRFTWSGARRPHRISLRAAVGDRTWRACRARAPEPLHEPHAGGRRAPVADGVTGPRAL